VLAIALLAVPVAFIVWMGWRHRWTADDGFINFRIVRHIVDGHGPVFNTGERVEAGTSPLWLAALSVLDLLLPFRLEWIAVISSLAATGGAVALAVFGTRRTLWPAVPKGAVLVPLGAIVYAALPPAWDFATSGLENGLGLLWIAMCWWLLCTRIATGRTEPAPRWWVPLVLSLGPLVRPDLALFSVAFIVALLVLCKRRFITIGRVIALAAVVPAVTELVRMAYYGDIVPNTAIAKEGMSSNWGQGWAYLRDYVTPYALVVPIVLLTVWWLVASGRSGGSGARLDMVVGLVVVTGGLLHALYIVRVGGDFMHARMLLPTTFMVLLPVSVVPVRARGWWLASIVLVWALACAGWMRPPYSTALPTGVSAAAAADPYDPGTGIADERLFWVRSSGTAHPVTLDDYLKRNIFAREGARVARLAAEGRRGLLLDPGNSARSLIPLATGVNAQIVVTEPALGLLAYAAGDRVDVVDDHGLTSPLAAHQRLQTRGRPGHEKILSDAWFVAEYADPGDRLPDGVDPREVAAARRALACEPLRSLVDDPTRRFTLADAIHNFEDALTTTSYRFATDPVVAAGQTCATGKGLRIPAESRHEAGGGSMLGGTPASAARGSSSPRAPRT
jgi:arabinofuranosyltransferase